MSFRETIMKQFGNPSGFLGRLAGIIMANRPSNKERNLWTISLLDIQKSDRLLEIGFGPGFAIQKAGEMITDGHIVGIDHSETMYNQAEKRNRQMIKTGRVELLCCSVENMPRFDFLFDKIYSLNVVQFWDDPIQVFKKLKTTLKPGGMIAVTYQPRNSGAVDEDAYEMGKKIMEHMKMAGFSKPVMEIKKMKPVAVICAIGYN